MFKEYRRPTCQQRYQATIRANFSLNSTQKPVTTVLRIQWLEVKTANFELTLGCSCWVQKDCRNWKPKVINHVWPELLQETSPESTNRLGEHGNIKDWCLSLRPRAHVVGVVRGGNWKDRRLEGDSGRLKMYWQRISGWSNLSNEESQALSMTYVKWKEKSLELMPTYWMPFTWTLKEPGMKVLNKGNVINC